MPAAARKDQGEGASEFVFSARQNAVLEAALRLLVEGGERALTTGAVAAAANCSKESLYKWFGDRDGLLAAVVTYQASKVRVFDDDAAPATRTEFEAALCRFAEDLMTVLFSDTSLALNRLSIGSVRGGQAGLGAVLLERGKRRIEDRARELLSIGRSRRFIHFNDAETADQALYGLGIGDRHIRALLGDGAALSTAAIPSHASFAVGQFLKLHLPAGGAEPPETHQSP